MLYCRFQFLSQDKLLRHCFYCTVTQLWLMSHCQSANHCRNQIFDGTVNLPCAGSCLSLLELYPTSSDKDPYCWESLEVLHFKIKINCYEGFDLPTPPLYETLSTCPRIHRSIHVFYVLFFPQKKFSKERYLFCHSHSINRKT